MELNDSNIASSIGADQQNVSVHDYLYLGLKIALILAIFLLVFNRKKRDLKKVQIKQSLTVPLSKIIVAVEIDGFFVAVSNKLQFGYQLLDLQPKQTTLIWKIVESVLGYRCCFKPLFSNREILNFIKGLKNISHIELMIYTSLTPAVTDQILKRLKLSEYFPIENRKFCDPKQHDTMKHAIDVDKYSRRVVIITPSKKDHNDQDEKYFLVQNPKGGKNKNFLKDCLRHIKNLVEENECIDTLHEELGQLKIDVQESDMSDMSDVQREMS